MQSRTKFADFRTLEPMAYCRLEHYSSINDSISTSINFMKSDET